MTKWKGGGGVNVTLKKKHKEQAYPISNHHWVCKFEKIEWNMFLRKENREIIIVLCHIN